MWDELDRELDLWSETGFTATLWWRDDDAVSRTAALETLLSIAARQNITPALAVVPARLDASLVGAVDGGVTILQHGYTHRNHAREHEKKCELGAARERKTMTDELSTGQKALVEAFGDRFLPVLVPPWNRIDAALLAELPGIGFAAVSTFGPRGSPAPVPHLKQANTHVDIIDWQGTRGFRGDASALGAAIAHLRARRRGSADPGEPTGLLTHHLVHDTACWRFVEEFLERTGCHRAVRWLGGRQVFG